jgi:hypothetical protein
MQTNECQIKTMERSDFRPWTLEIRGNLNRAAVAAKGCATEAAVFRVGYWIFNLVISFSL